MSIHRQLFDLSAMSFIVPVLKNLASALDHRVSRLMRLILLNTTLKREVVFISGVVFFLINFSDED